MANVLLNYIITFSNISNVFDFNNFLNKQFNLRENFTVPILLNILSVIYHSLNHRESLHEFYERREEIDRLTVRSLGIRRWPPVHENIAASLSPPWRIVPFTSQGEPSLPSSLSAFSLHRLVSPDCVVNAITRNNCCLPFARFNRAEYLFAGRLSKTNLHIVR